MVNMGFRACVLSLTFAAAVVLSFRPSSARADEAADPRPIAVDCDSGYLTRVTIDGLQTDWEAEVGPVHRVQQLVEGDFRYDWTGPNDASFKPWCRYNRHGIYFAVLGRDNHVVEPRGGRPGDRMFVSLELGPRGDREPVIIELPLYDSADGLALPVWENGDPVEGARGEIAIREGGYFLEFSIPSTALTGLEDPFEPVPFALTHVDWDYDADRERAAVISTAAEFDDDLDEWGTLRFDGPDRMVAEVARELGAEVAGTPEFAEVGGADGPELVFVAGATLVVAGPSLGEFDWVMVEALPDGATFEGIRTHDIDHDGGAEIFVTYRRTRRSIDAGGDVEEAFTDAWRLADGEFARLLRQAVRRTLPDGQVASMSLRFRDRSDRSVVRFEPDEDATTATRDSWIQVAPRSDDEYEPLLLPWSERDRVDWDLTAAGEWVVIPTD